MDLEQMGRKIGQWVKRVAGGSADEAELTQFERMLPVELLVRNTT
jgi:hypothetical protein